MALSLSACSRSHDIRSFARKGQLVFEMSGSPQVNEVSVEQISARTHSVWRITSVVGKGQKLGDISYNHTPFGFVESVPVHPSGSDNSIASRFGLPTIASKASS
jgi:hypothetical protein